MKVKAGMVLGAAMVLGGCMGSAPQTADEMLAAVNGGAMFSEQTTQKVARSYSVVVASVRKGADKCMNRNVQQSFTSSPGPGFAPVRQTMNFYYTTDVRSRGKFTEVAMHKRIGNGGNNILGMKQEGIAYVADIHPVSGGAELKFYGGKFGYGPINKAVAQWAEGGAIRCPDLP
ncbi:MAG: hypothetical protein KJO30_14740 [Boseongicola sp.]|nr:hypothetical protein [Boseongicola sp.]